MKQLGKGVKLSPRRIYIISSSKYLTIPVSTTTKKSASVVQLKCIKLINYITISFIERYTILV